MSSFIHAIRSAVLPGARSDALNLDIEGEPDALASIIETPLSEAKPQGADMSVTQAGAGAASAASGVLATAVAAVSGGEDGFKSAMDRINAVVSAESIKGDAGRLSAALELANAAPTMSADAITTFVASHVPANASRQAGAPAPLAAKVNTAQAYEENRAAATRLAMPGAAGGKPAATIDREGIFAARRNQPKGA